MAERLGSGARVAAASLELSQVRKALTLDSPSLTLNIVICPVIHAILSFLVRSAFPFFPLSSAAPGAPMPLSLGTFPSTSHSLVGFSLTSQ